MSLGSALGENDLAFAVGNTGLARRMTCSASGRQTLGGVVEVHDGVDA